MSARRPRPVQWIAALLCSFPVLAQAQAPAAPAASSRQESGMWIVVGGASTSILADCTDCEEDPRYYAHTGSVLVNVGGALNPRTDIGVEVLWVPSKTRNGEPIRSTFLMAAFQFRPWQTRGFFLKAGSGIAFVKNWVVDFEGGDESPPFTSAAFGLGLGTGWEWRASNRVGAQLFGAQHVVALGDLRTADTSAENVLGNYWSIGAAIVIR